MDDSHSFALCASFTSRAGRACFPKVYSATYRDKKVAVKIMRWEGASLNSRESQGRLGMIGLGMFLSF